MNFEEEWVKEINGTCGLCGSSKLELVGNKNNGTKVYYCRNCDIYNQEEI